MNQPHDVEDDSMMDWEPVQLPQQWYGVVMPLGACHEVHCSSLHRLQAA